jgi:putative endonuclease
MDDRMVVGRAAEQAVAEELERRGYFVVDRNARDRHAELDLVVRRGAEIVAVEVRSRRSGEPDAAADSVDARKRGKVRGAMERWLAVRPEDYEEVRFFVAAVAWRDGLPDITLIEDAF